LIENIYLPFGFYLLQKIKFSRSFRWNFQNVLSSL